MVNRHNRSEAPELTDAYAERGEGRNTDVEASIDTVNNMASGAETTAGDLDVNQYQAKVVGEEAVGGTASTPGQDDNVDRMAQAVGVEMDDRQPLRVQPEMERRDDRRAELDPEFSEDYDRRQRDLES